MIEGVKVVAVQERIGTVFRMVGVDRIGRAFSPFGRVVVLSRGVAPVWYSSGPLALARGVSKFPEGPKARRHANLGTL